MKAIKKTLLIKHWPDMKVIFNDHRETIGELCTSVPHSIQDLSRELGLNPGSVHNHVKKLHAAGYITIAETREINGIVEKKYSRAAQFFKFAELTGKEQEQRNKFIAAALQRKTLNILGADKQALVRNSSFQLNAEDYQAAKEKLEGLFDFLKDRNGSGDISGAFLFSFGKTDC